MPRSRCINCAASSRARRVQAPLRHAAHAVRVALRARSRLPALQVRLLLGFFFVGRHDGAACPGHAATDLEFVEADGHALLSVELRLRADAFR